MKHFAYLIAGLAMPLFIDCKKETTSTTPLNEQPGTTAIVVQSGSFSNGPYGSVKGMAKVYETDGVYQLALEDFSSSNGPDLKVYLGKEMQPINFVNLGSLKSTAGNQLYPVPISVNVADYSFALIHCQQYNHLFGFAELKP